MNYSYQIFWKYFFIVTIVQPLPFQDMVHLANIYWMLIRCWSTQVDMSVFALTEFIPVGSRVDHISDKYWNLGCALTETNQGWQRQSWSEEGTGCSRGLKSFTTSLVPLKSCSHHILWFSKLRFPCCHHNGSLHLRILHVVFVFYLMYDGTGFGIVKDSHGLWISSMLD